MKEFFTAAVAVSLVAGLSACDKMSDDQIGSQFRIDVADAKQVYCGTLKARLNSLGGILSKRQSQELVLLQVKMRTAYTQSCE